MSERKRAKNFTERETLALLSLISQEKNIIENKKTDAITNKQKTEAWEKIALAFNAMCPEDEHRTPESLKKLWDNKKRSARKSKGDERKEILLTGGGPAPNIKEPHSDLILSILDPLTVIGGDVGFGSDSQSLSCSQEVTQETDFEFEYEPEYDFQNEYENNTSEVLGTPVRNWKKYSPSDLMSERNPALKRPLEETSNRRNTSVAPFSSCASTSGPAVPSFASTVRPAVSPSLRTSLSRPMNPPEPPAAAPLEPTPLSAAEAPVPDRPPVAAAGTPYLHNAPPVSLPAPRTNEPARGANRPALVRVRGANRRRPTATVVRTMASSQLAEKYNELADKKCAIADITQAKIQRELEQHMAEHNLKVQALQLDLEIKREKLRTLRHADA